MSHRDGKDNFKHLVHFTLNSARLANPSASRARPRASQAIIVYATSWRWLQGFTDRTDVPVFNVMDKWLLSISIEGKSSICS